MNYYYAKDSKIELVSFNKYTIDTNGIIRNKKTGKIVRPYNTQAGYKAASVMNNAGRKCNIFIGRAIASTYLGSPPTPDHTADHIDRDNNNDTLENIRWATKIEQVNNRVMPPNNKSTFIIVKDGLEKTASDWVGHLKNLKNKFNREYTEGMIIKYAQHKHHGFAYKDYPNLPGEMWKEIDGSKSTRSHWEISNMSRVKCITNHAENVLEGERLSLVNGYPCIMFGQCHIIAFKTFFPNLWKAKKLDEIVLHEDDDRLDFRPHKLRLGTRGENGIEAHDNGCFDGTDRKRQKCLSYINGIYEKEHDSHHDAVRYLKSIGFEKAAQSKISLVISEKRKDGGPKIAYGRTWKLSV